VYIPCIAFIETPCFHFSVFQSKTGISEGCNKDVELASREPNEYTAYSCFITPEKAKIFQVSQPGVIL
jgi:hypothetical protein